VKVDVDNCSISQIPYEYLTPLQAAIGVVQKVRASKHLCSVSTVTLVLPLKGFTLMEPIDSCMKAYFFSSYLRYKSMCRDLGRGRGAILFRKSLLQVNGTCAHSRSHLNTGLSFFVVHLFINHTILYEQVHCTHKLNQLMQDQVPFLFIFKQVKLVSPVLLKKKNFSKTYKFF